MRFIDAFIPRTAENIRMSNVVAAQRCCILFLFGFVAIAVSYLQYDLYNVQTVFAIPESTQTAANAHYDIVVNNKSSASKSSSVDEQLKQQQQRDNEYNGTSFDDIDDNNNNDKTATKQQTQSPYQQKQISPNATPETVSIFRDTTTNVTSIVNDNGGNSLQQNSQRNSFTPNPVCCEADGGTRDYNTTSSDNTKETKRRTTVDVVSIGSITKPDLQIAQRNTFGTHDAVRRVFYMTEENDTDTDCTEMSMEQMQNIVEYCTDPHVGEQSDISRIFRRNMYDPENHSVGWLCAQTRPIDGLYQALQSYKTTTLASNAMGDDAISAGTTISKIGESKLPNYLILIDDDTYLNMDVLLPTLIKIYPDSVNHVVAGCTYMRPKKIRFIFPVGGSATILTKSALLRLTTPMHCDADDNKLTGGSNSYEQVFCWQLQKNLMGEEQFFSNGMSLGDLMYAFMSGVALSKFQDWNATNSGYCFHSDHTISYFFSFYFLSLSDTDVAAAAFSQRHNNSSADISYNVQAAATATSPDYLDILRYERDAFEKFGLPHTAQINNDDDPYDFDFHNGFNGQCDNLKEKCMPNSSAICHYVTADQMLERHHRGRKIN